MKRDLFTNVLIGGGRASSREPVPARIKRKVRDRARNICEYPTCRQKENLQFHHKNMKNSDNRASNLELLCPNHHAKRHNQKIRKVVSRDLFGEKKTRLVKKSNATRKSGRKSIGRSSGYVIVNPLTRDKKRVRKDPFDFF